MRTNDKLRNKDFFLAFLVLSVLVASFNSCSTTKNLPQGERLYTGIKQLDFTDKDSSYVEDELINDIEKALACPPNNALLGSSSARTPIPLGLWVYNANINKEKRFNRWMLDWLAKPPVLISTVKPDTRTKIAQTILRDNGYFSGRTSYKIIHDPKDSVKAKVHYTVTFNEPHTIDSIRYLRMHHRADTLLRISSPRQLIHKGDLFSIATLEAERQRISTLMRDNGYYFFKPEYVVFQADSTISKQKISLKIGLKQNVPRSTLRPWKIGNTNIYLNGYDNELPTESVRYKDVTIHHEGKLRVRPNILYAQLHFGKGDLYSSKKQRQTQEALNKLEIFRYTEFQYRPKDSLKTCDTMDVHINMSYDYPVSSSLEINATVNDNDYAGPGASLNLTKRNIFGGGEVFTTSLYGSYEWYTGQYLQENTGIINNYEAGIKAALMFPRLVLPRIGKKAYDFSASTHVDLRINLLNRARYYNTMMFKGGLSYEFLPDPIRHHSFSPLKLTFNKLQSTTLRFDSIIDHNPSLYQSLQDQFIPAIEYTYTLDNSSVREERSKTWWRLSISEAGNLVSGVHALFGGAFNEEKKLLGNTYAQFLKIKTELRYNYYINRTSRLAMRIGGGIIYSYGNSTIAPYNERFYIGGANSIRAFTIRSIGPGRFAPDPDNMYAYIDQNGDIKLEGNIEYRTHLVGNLEGAVFLDAGNVWLLRQGHALSGGTLKLKHLLNDIALGTGIGFRYDIEMLIFRFDIGYALHFPYDTGKNGYFNTPSFKDGIGLHLALGYPF